MSLAKDKIEQLIPMMFRLKKAFGLQPSGYVKKKLERSSSSMYGWLTQSIRILDGTRRRGELYPM